PFLDLPCALTIEKMSPDETAQTARRLPRPRCLDDRHSVAHHGIPMQLDECVSNGAGDAQEALRLGRPAGAHLRRPGRENLLFSVLPGRLPETVNDRRHDISLTLKRGAVKALFLGLPDLCIGRLVQPEQVLLHLPRPCGVLLL